MLREEDERSNLFTPKCLTILTARKARWTFQSEGRKYIWREGLSILGNLNVTSRWRVSATEAFIQWIQKDCDSTQPSLSSEPAALSAAGQSLILTRLSNIRNSSKLQTQYTGSKQQRLVTHFILGAAYSFSETKELVLVLVGPLNDRYQYKGREVNNKVLLESVWSELLPMEFTQKRLGAYMVTHFSWEWMWIDGATTVVVCLLFWFIVLSNHFCFSKLYFIMYFEIYHLKFCSCSANWKKKKKKYCTYLMDKDFFLATNWC